MQNEGEQWDRVGSKPTGGGSWHLKSGNKGRFHCKATVKVNSVGLGLTCHCCYKKWPQMQGHTMSQICGLEIQLSCEEHWLLFQDWVSILGTYPLGSQPPSFKGPKALFWPQRYTMYYIDNGSHWGQLRVFSPSDYLGQNRQPHLFSGWAAQSLGRMIPNSLLITSAPPPANIYAFP